MRIRILDSALADLQEGRSFYSDQGPGVGEHFSRTMKANIRSLSRMAGVHPLNESGVHRMICSTFPYQIHYRVQDDRVVVHAVIDSRRDPEWIRRKIAGL